LPQHLPKDKAKGKTIMIALGKAAGDMAQVALDNMELHQGLIIVPKGGLPHGFVPPPHVDVIFASHPVPDKESARAGTEALRLANSLNDGDRLLVLLSGGGSSLMVAPKPPLTLEDKIQINDELLRSGAPIHIVNRIRRQLSLVKGGGLAAAAAPGEVISLVLSDIPGDNVTMVASGPTAALTDDHDWQTLALNWGIKLPTFSVQSPYRHNPNARALTLVANADMALKAMETVAQKAGYATINLGSALEGDATKLAQAHAALALHHAKTNQRVAIISGGETSVAVSKSSGVGGRNQNYTASLCLALNGHASISAFAVDSDGIDGNSDVAGAMIFPDTLTRLNALNINLKNELAQCNVAPAFIELQDALITGPSFTNVNDLRCILVSPF
jgi:glycerate 2-kinase